MKVQCFFITFAPKYLQNEAFPVPAHGGRGDVARWQARWPRIQAQIDSMELALPGYAEEREMLRRHVKAGGCAVHHSRAFNQAYRPHYRIVDAALLDAYMKRHGM